VACDCTVGNPAGSAAKSCARTVGLPPAAAGRATLADCPFTVPSAVFVGPVPAAMPAAAGGIAEPSPPPQAQRETVSPNAPIQRIRKVIRIGLRQNLTMLHLRVR
jgi:hypothetical protein